MGQDKSATSLPGALLSRTLELERAAVAFFVEAGALVPTAHGRTLLRDLAREAELHVEILRAECRALERAGHWLSLEEAASSAPDDDAGQDEQASAPPSLSADAEEAEILAQALTLAAQLYRLCQQLQASAGAEAADVLEFVLRREAAHCAALQERLAQLQGAEEAVAEDEEPGMQVEDGSGPRRARRFGRRRSRPR